MGDAYQPLPVAHSSKDLRLTADNSTMDVPYYVIAGDRQIRVLILIIESVIRNLSVQRDDGAQQGLTFAVRTPTP
jgi:hypothetical protein